MTLYALYIFDRHCVCVFYTSWNRPPQGAGQAGGSDAVQAAGEHAVGGGAAAGTGADGPGGGVVSGGASGGGLAGAADKQAEENAKLVYGVVYSLRNIVAKISPKQGDNFVSYRTNMYKLHYFETAANLKFVLLTDPSMDNMGEVLRAIHAQIYVEYVSKNALMQVDSGPIGNELFRTNLVRFLQSRRLLE